MCCNYNESKFNQIWLSFNIQYGCVGWMWREWKFDNFFFATCCRLRQKNLEFCKKIKEFCFFNISGSDPNYFLEKYQTRQVILCSFFSRLFNVLKCNELNQLFSSIFLLFISSYIRIRTCNTRYRMFFFYKMALD